MLCVIFAPRCSNPYMEIDRASADGASPGNEHARGHSGRPRPQDERRRTHGLDHSYDASGAAEFARNRGAVMSRRSRFTSAPLRRGACVWSRYPVPAECLQITVRR